MKDGAPVAYPCTGMSVGEEAVVTCLMPSQALAVGETADCTVSVLDGRDWGGCVDVQMVSAAAILPPSPPPAPLVSNTGPYKMTKNTVTDTSAASFTCCALEAEMVVPTYEMGLAASFTATLSGKANGCTAALRPLQYLAAAPSPSRCTTGRPPPNATHPCPKLTCPVVIAPRCRPTDSITAPIEYGNDMVIDMQVPMNIVTAGSSLHTYTPIHLQSIDHVLRPLRCIYAYTYTLGFSNRRRQVRGRGGARHAPPDIRVQRR